MTPLPLLLALSTAPWANAPLPTPPDLSGRAVLLEFSDDWDPAGQRLLLHAQRAKAAFGDSLALLSVRSPAAGDPHGLASLERQALRREIMHPMVEDDKASLAAASGISGTGLALLGPDGAVLRRFDPGSPYEALERAVAAVVGSLPQRSRPPLAMALERDDFIDRPLAFPTQLAYDAKSDRLLICDTGHNRVVLASGSGRVKVVIGNGAVDYRDGAMARAGFDHPRGVAFAAGDRLLIADTGNDAIRTVDLKAERVTTLIDDPYRLPGPRALLFDGSTLYVAEPLSHSLAAADSKSWTPYRFAGDGREGSRDGLVA
ncbi:MAG: hypothetical protein KGK30_05670, partial [Elusimicrobia bacterium]|nr:hypothetical protein [Elusimicrobiota bacterium]